MRVGFVSADETTRRRDAGDAEDGADDDARCKRTNRLTNRRTSVPSSPLSRRSCAIVVISPPPVDACPSPHIFKSDVHVLSERLDLFLELLHHPNLFAHALDLLLAEVTPAWKASLCAHSPNLIGSPSPWRAWPRRLDRWGAHLIITDAMSETRHRPRVRRRVQVLGTPARAAADRLDTIPLKVGEASIEQFQFPLAFARGARPGVRGGFQRSLLFRQTRDAFALLRKLALRLHQHGRERVWRPCPQSAASLRVSSRATSAFVVFLRDDGLRLGANVVQFRLRRRHMFAECLVARDERLAIAPKRRERRRRLKRVRPTKPRSSNDSRNLILERGVGASAPSDVFSAASRAEKSAARKTPWRSSLRRHQRPAATLGVRNLRRGFSAPDASLANLVATAQAKPPTPSARAARLWSEARARAPRAPPPPPRAPSPSPRGTRVASATDAASVRFSARGSAPALLRHGGCNAARLGLHARLAALDEVALLAEDANDADSEILVYAALLVVVARTRPGPPGEARPGARGPQRTRRADPTGGTPWTRGDPWGGARPRRGSAGRDGRRARARPRGPRRGTRRPRGNRAGGPRWRAPVRMFFTIAGTTTGGAASPRAGATLAFRGERRGTLQA